MKSDGQEVVLTKVWGRGGLGVEADKNYRARLCFICFLCFSVVSVRGDYTNQPCQTKL